MRDADSKNMLYLHSGFALVHTSIFFSFSIPDIHLQTGLYFILSNFRTLYMHDMAKKEGLNGVL